jgi:alkylresorcinol/alkylpyrone synthase
LTEVDTFWSAEVLRERGNISSPFVIHVLQRALHGEAPGGIWWMSSFGAGFSSHGALLEVDRSPA